MTTTASPFVPFSPAPEFGYGDVRPAAAPVTIAARRGGELWVVLQALDLGLSCREMVSIGVWWDSPEGHIPLPRKCALFHPHEIPALILALQSFLAGGDGFPKVWGRARESQLLRLIAEGTTDSATLAQAIFGPSPLDQSRLRSLVTRARKAGLLERKLPHRLTPAGVERVEQLNAEETNHD